MGRLATHRLALAGALALAVLALGVATAGAATGIRNTSGAASLTVTARGPITITTSGINIICTYDLLINVAGSINKTVGVPLATILSNGSRITNCNGGVVPGSVQSDISFTWTGFAGALPAAITSLTGIGGVTWGFTGGVAFGTNRCTYAGNMGFALNGPGTAYSSVRLSGTFPSTGPIGCPPSITVTNSNFVMYANAALGTTLTSIAVVLF